MNIKPVTPWLSILLGAAIANPAFAVELPATSPYIGQQDRAIKALSPQEIADLKAGKGMGFSKVAELNHLPGPSHVIALADPLMLTPGQRSEAQATFDVMSGDAKRLGAAIVTKEASLEQLFLHQSALDAKAIRQTVMEIARMQGELRFVHLDAHVAMSRVLSPAQIATYDQLRGYGTPTGSTSDAAANPHHH